MRVLVLGGTGFIGQRLVHSLAESGWARPVAASSRARPGGDARVVQCQVDTLDAAQVRQALRGVDAVVNCVAGSAAAIADGAAVLAQAALQAGKPLIVHMSSMAAYGQQEGALKENSPLDPSLGWYARAKCEAEAHMRAYVQAGGRSVVFRPGCVCGPGSDMWVARIAGLLRAGRLGDLGVQGDGWSNLVHVDDVCAAVLAALRAPPSGSAALQFFNLAAPDSPRWNQYFTDLALAIDATPVRRIGRRRLLLDAKLLSPALKIAEIAARKLRLDTQALPIPISPSLLKLWRQHIQIDPAESMAVLGLAYRKYDETLAALVARP
ncbi:NAD-dependent epimerase/dehydratase family protein [Pseudorhodoferax sp.]|uniref:NAD-dependent epimerase/dehydratase family protein n=1 Tax=Pseudorhodoferax sp. TaxID=1993553 RepID=UPI002DD64A6E|nr:NAD(P)-dependent oxidoreductase [Pseudorhodoferax sp.]